MHAITPACPLDAGAIGNILSVSNHLMPWLPPLHSEAEDIRHCGDMIDGGWVRIFRNGGRAAGFIARRGLDIHALYVLPQFQGRGVGAALLDDAKASCDALFLWCYAQNESAAQFYVRQGFIEVNRTDGRGNDVHLPDVHYQWIKGRTA